MGQKLQDGKKVLCMSLNHPHSESRPGKTAGPNTSPFWIIRKLYDARKHTIFTFLGPYGTYPNDMNTTLTNYLFFQP